MSNVVGTCPVCGREVIDKGERARSYTCESNRWKHQPDGSWALAEGCGFEMWKELARLPLSADIVSELLACGRTSEVVSGFTSRNGEGFSAYVVLDAETGGYSFEFPERPQEGEGDCEDGMSDCAVANEAGER